jgi:hypothetical protein
LQLAVDVDFDVLLPGHRRNPVVAEQIVRTDPSLRAPLHQALADHLTTLEDAARLTPALLALGRPQIARLSSSLSTTTGWWRRRPGRVGAGACAGVKDIPGLVSDGLVEPDGSLRVMHLHGSLDDPPEQLVLTADAMLPRRRSACARTVQRAVGLYNL